MVRDTLWLVGMMGAGKSTVGPVLARRLRRRFIDVDEEIKRADGREISQIFAEEGEAFFRRIERSTIEALAGKRAVVALGGGAIAQSGAPARLTKSGTVVYLRGKPETLLARIGDCRTRPMLRDVSRSERLARLKDLLEARSRAYETASVVVDVDGSDVAQIAEQVRESLVNAGGGIPASRVRSPKKTMRAGPRARTVEVDLGERSYPIRLGAGTLPRLGREVARISRRAIIVTVPGVGRRYGSVVRRSLREAGVRVHRIDVPDGDATKNLGQVAKLYDEFLRLGADRDTVLVALGGGMVGDLAGFAAATFLRGISFVQVPTTVLAMVDSSIGGKVGVNLPQGKNLVGAFHQPRLVWVDTDVLRSLPDRDRAAGFAEVIKKAAIWDADFFHRLERDVESLMSLDPKVLMPVLARACEIKAEVVSRDEREGGLRMLLNFGHTMGHAAETLSGYQKILHGEAVAMGMVYAAKRSEALGLAPKGTANRIEALCGRVGLPTELPSFERKAYLDVLRVDKKRRDSRVRYIVLRGIGRADTVSLTPAEILPSRRPAS